MRKFAIFAGSDYAELGGWDDFVRACESLDGAVAVVVELRNVEWAHIVDLATLEIVKTFKRDKTRKWIEESDPV